VRGAGSRAFSEFASGLRGELYAPAAQQAAGPRTAAELMSQFGASGSVAPSSAVTGYAFRHAAAVSRWAGQGSVIDRLTDPRGYTGAHKHRFDADGRGRGLDGREGGADLDFVRASMPGGTIAAAVKAGGTGRSARDKNRIEREMGTTTGNSRPTPTFLR
jgi:hypothetical protein